MNSKTSILDDLYSIAIYINGDLDVEHTQLHQIKQYLITVLSGYNVKKPLK